ncbi:MAG TPA: hydrogenase 2 operon protein HybA [Anaeromyxobacteraceae bacterium]|nr:hydrogenase 2 operon protein HybA [Anaeromyxobacteraceae bacterium]
MLVSRRSLLKGAVAASAAALATKSEAHEKVEPSPEAVGMLYDSTRCVGCRACVAACKEANHLPVDPSDFGPDHLEGPLDLSATTKTVVQTRTTSGGPAFVKRQCMHCVDPACVSACMLGALHKEGRGKRDTGGEKPGSGVVLYDPSLCVGCRYCQIACAYVAPRFEWRKAFPRMVKCEMCHTRRDPNQGGAYAVANPACCEVCPTGAVAYGPRSALLAEARRRQSEEPTRYAPRIFGEQDGGGTQVLYLAAAGVSFRDLGFPDLPRESFARLSERVSHAPYLEGFTPIALYAAAAFVIRRQKKHSSQAHDEKKEEP